MKPFNYLFLIFFALWTVSSSAQTTDALPLQLKVGSYNVGHFNQGSLGGFQLLEKQVQAEIQNWKKWVSEQHLDIVAVQEWNHFFDKDSLHHAAKSILDPFYNNIHFGTQNSWIYNGIATNFELVNLREVKLGGQYYVILGDINIGGKTLTVGSVHVPWQKEMHDGALETLIGELKKYEYFICMGDMNAKDKEQLKFTEAGFHMANGGHQGWFSTAASKQINSGHQGGADTNIDNIVTSPNIKIFNVSAPKTGLNDLDHLPIIADIVLTW